MVINNVKAGRPSCNGAIVTAQGRAIPEVSWCWFLRPWNARVGVGSELNCDTVNRAGMVGTRYLIILCDSNGNMCSGWGREIMCVCICQVIVFVWSTYDVLYLSKSILAYPWFSLSKRYEYWLRRLNWWGKRCIPVGIANVTKMSWCDAFSLKCANITAKQQSECYAMMRMSLAKKKDLMKAVEVCACSHTSWIPY